MWRIIVEGDANDGFCAVNQFARVQAFFDVSLQIVHIGMAFFRNPFHISGFRAGISGGANAAGIESERKSILFYLFGKGYFGIREHNDGYFRQN